MSKFTQNLKRAKSFNAICRAKKLPEATAKQLGIESIAGENSLRVENMGEETHLYLSGAVGGSFYDEAGITEKEVRGAFKSIPKGKKINVHTSTRKADQSKKVSESTTQSKNVQKTLPATLTATPFQLRASSRSLPVRLSVRSLPFG